ncbi:MAG: hypothetical protein PWQ47_894 [Methanothermococcus sp.]|nr:hypothetical protein [Methanothermococcus sp.]
MHLKRKLWGFLILIFFLGSLNFSNAIVFEDYNVVCEIDQNNKIHETIILKIYNDDSEEIKDMTYIVPQEISDLVIESDKGVKSYSSVSNDGSTEITIVLEQPIKKGERGVIKIEFNSDIVWDKLGKKLLSMSVPAVPSNFSMSIKLPPGAAVVSPAEGLLSITPQDYVIDTDGKRIFIKWERELDGTEKYFTTTVTYVVLTPEGQNQNILYFIIGGLVLFSGFLIIRHIRNNRRNKKEIYELNSQIELLHKELELLNVNLANKEKEIRRLEEINELIVDESEDLKKKIDNYESKVEKLNSEIEDLRTNCEKEREKNNELTDKLKKEIKEKEEKIKELINCRNLIEEYQKEIKTLSEKLKEKEEQIKILKKKIEDYEKNRSETLMNILTDEEKMIIGLIKEHGDITQKDLVEITGMTKPKISRMVSDLEQRGIIRKVKIGRINKIVISDDFKGDCYGP